RAVPAGLVHVPRVGRTVHARPARLVDDAGLGVDRHRDRVVLDLVVLGLILLAAAVRSGTVRRADLDLGRPVRPDGVVGDGQVVGVTGTPEESLTPQPPTGTTQKSWLLYVTVLWSNVVPALFPQNPAIPFQVRVLFCTSLGMETVLPPIDTTHPWLYEETTL